MGKSLYDPVLTAQLANGFSLQGLIENYLPDGDASRGYATFLEWRNIEYKANAKRRFHHPTEPIRLCIAQSGIFTPASEDFSRDAVAAECDANQETVVIHDVDVEVLRRHRESGGVQNWNDRRLDLYRIRYNEDGQQLEI